MTAFRVPRLSPLVVALVVALAAPAASAAALMPADLQQQLATTLPFQRLEVVVTFDDPDAIDAGEIGLLNSLGILGGRRFEALPIAGVRATPAQIRALAARSGVRSIYPNRALHLVNDEARELSRVNYANAHPGDFGQTTPYTGAGVTAMINDSGIDASHADLALGAHVVENVQALTNVPASLLGFAPPLHLTQQLDTDLLSGHGTHCAGIFGGSGARSAGHYAGVAPGAQLVGYGSGAGIAILDAVGGLDYAIAHRDDYGAPIRVVSNSWGTSGGDFDPADPVNVASYAAYQAGIVVLFAAGNDGPGADTHNPYAQAPWVISVAAADKTKALADFSSRGNPGEGGSFTMPDGATWTYSNEPTLTATGVDVVSTRALTNVAANGGANDVGVIPLEQLPYYTMISGTSMATPHVAGIAALVLEAKPNATPAEVRQILVDSAAPMAGRASWEVGAGHVDAYEALRIASGH